MTLLETHGLSAHYESFQALFDVNFRIEAGECVALIGSNGAGKSTFLKSLAGLIANGNDTIAFKGHSVGNVVAQRMVRKGIALVPEGRRLFKSLTVEENLLIGAEARRAGPWTLKRIYELFPNIAERKSNLGGQLSGGQQQMVAIGRALMSNPEVLLCDEISLGLAPVVVRELYDRMAILRAERMSLVIVEQDITQATRVADRLYCLRSGRVALEGRASDLSRADITQAYFGVEDHAHASH